MAAICKKASSGMFREFFIERIKGAIHSNAQKILIKLRISHAFDSDPETQLSATVQANTTRPSQGGENRLEAPSPCYEMALCLASCVIHRKFHPKGFPVFFPLSRIASMKITRRIPEEPFFVCG